MTDEDDVRNLIGRFDREVVVDLAIPVDGGTDPLWPRFERSALNQISDGTATLSRYAIWANTVRNNLLMALDAMARGDDVPARRHLIRSANSLAAFCELQMRMSSTDADDGTGHRTERGLLRAPAREDLRHHADGELDERIDELESGDAIGTAEHLALLEERARRSSTVLDVERSLAQLVKAARDGRFTTYGALAEANGIEWKRARPLMIGKNGHLDRLIDVCHARGLPYLTAICVNKENVDTGGLSDKALEGFIACIRRLRVPVLDERKYLEDCQVACFEWGRNR